MFPTKMSAPTKGSSITAIVEETLDNCIMVRVIHGSRTFRGVLLDENNSSISRTPVRENVDRTREIPPDFLPRERSSIVMLQSSPRRTANSRRSGLSQRIILLSQQEEGRSETVIVNSMPTDDLRGFVRGIDRSQLSDVQKKRHRPPKMDKPLKKTASKAKGIKSVQSTGVKRKKTLPKEFVRPFKRPRGLPISPSKTEGKSLNNIVLKPCLVKVCPLQKPILNQSSTVTGVQTLHAPESGLNSVSEEKIASRKFDREEQDVQTQTLSRIPEIRRLSVDLEQLPMSSVVADEVSDTMSLLSERTSTIDVERLSEMVNASGEETDSATSFIDEDVILEMAEEKATVAISVTTQDEEFETVDILSEERSTGTDVLGNEVEKIESVFTEKPEASADVGETASAVISETAHSLGDGTSIRQNSPQTSDVKVTTNISNSESIEPDSLPMQTAPQTSNECERLSNCSGSSTAMLSIVVNLQPISMDTRKDISAPNPTTQSDAGCKSPRVSVEDIVWGKVHDHPWWPGKVSSLSGTINEVGSMLAKDASIAWFGSNTRSVLPVTHLSHFLANFNERHLPDNDGCYRTAVQEAIQAHKHQLISITL